MHSEELYNQLKSELENKIHFLEDKPGETLDSTIKALWITASGTYMSGEKAMGLELPLLNNVQVNNLKNLVEQRLNNVPLAHLTHRQNFMGIELLADKRALIPRKETEILGRKALEISKEISAQKRSVKIIDVCCGSGNLAVSLAFYNPTVKVFAADLSREAVELTKDNIKHLGLENRVEARQSDFLSSFEEPGFYGSIDLMVCNPPYITSAKVKNMPGEISLNEPSMAFDGGMIGIKIIQKIISESPKFLSTDGRIAFEVGVGQGPFVMQLIERSDKYTSIDSVADKAGNIRVIAAQKK